MSLFVASLASGSNGNCYYIANEKEAVLIDAGISCREIEKRMKLLGLSAQKLKAVFISHDHTDHIKGLSVLLKKFGLPVYITKATAQNGNLFLPQYFSFSPEETVVVGDLHITAFAKNHDAADPCSFIVACNGIKAGVFTDIGFACSEVIRYFKQCHAVFLETNYDEEMLEKGNYPYHLKKRIRSDKGHLSNNQALELFKMHRSTFMSHLFLSHLSKNNNCPQLASKLFNTHAGSIKIIVASRCEQTEVYTVTGLPAKETYYLHANKQMEFSFA